MDHVLEVKNLEISFRTSGGILKAVRDISFSLERGKTLAIVGESGSGKSVTSKAILGILAGNSVTESGEILYDGRDLLRISEEEMCRIRGDRISMIFQDPLSSLNPIVKIGRQITEAMLLKNNRNRRAARRDFNKMLALLRQNMIAAGGDEGKVSEMAETFNQFNIEAIKMENRYNNAFAAADSLAADIEEFVFLAEKSQKGNVRAKLKEFARTIVGIKEPFLTKGYDEKLASLASELSSAADGFQKSEKVFFDDKISSVLDRIVSLLGEITAGTRPDFFRIGYYKLKNPEADFSAKSIDELNKSTRAYLDENFMLEFLALAEKGMKYSFDQALEKKKDVMADLKAVRDFYRSGRYDRAAALSKAKEISASVEASIDPMEINKDSTVYTFRVSLHGAVEKYFSTAVRNPLEKARCEKQTRKKESLVRRVRTAEWKVVPKNVNDFGELHDEIVKVCDNLIARYERYIAGAGNVDFSARAVEVVDYFKKKASEAGYRVTKKTAKERAVKLMKEVGIPEPHIRYYQYPFEFSGGMRQRIVIAIALAANPDILICDEPTTALDVTIQAQILELINKLKEERNLSVIFITHDLGVVANMADEIAVMYAGKIVEYGTADDVFYDPRHPYTWALLSSMPDLETTEKLDAIPGTPPNMIYPPVGDAFADRNKYAMKIDFEKQPPKFAVSDTHWAATWLLHPDAPKIELPKIIADRIERMKRQEVLHHEQQSGE